MLAPATALRRGQRQGRQARRQARCGFAQADSPRFRQSCAAGELACPPQRLPCGGVARYFLHGHSPSIGFPDAGRQRHGNTRSRCRDNHFQIDNRKLPALAPAGHHPPRGDKINVDDTSTIAPVYHRLIATSLRGACACSNTQPYQEGWQPGGWSLPVDDTALLWKIHKRHASRTGPEAGHQGLTQLSKTVALLEISAASLQRPLLRATWPPPSTRQLMAPPPLLPLSNHARAA